MSDIVDRLRAPVMVTAHNASGTGFDRYEAEPSPTDIEAADEITRLRSLLKEAREALENVPVPGRLSWVAWRDAFREWHAHTVIHVLSSIKGSVTGVQSKGRERVS